MFCLIQNRKRQRNLNRDMSMKFNYSLILFIMSIDFSVNSSIKKSSIQHPIVIESMHR